MNEKNVEYLRNSPLDKLVILVHPYSEGLDLDYETVADAAYDRAVNLYPPINTSEFLFVMPHIEDLTKESRQMELVRRLKNRSMIPDNVQILPDIVQANKSYKAVFDELAKFHKTINHQTEIIVGGERIDNCGESFIRELLKSSDIAQVRISRYTSIYSDPSNQAEASAWQPRIRGTQTSVEGGYFVITKLNPTALHKS